jgi:hypothetical protein
MILKWINYLKLVSYYCLRSSAAAENRRRMDRRLGYRLLLFNMIVEWPFGVTHRWTALT